MQFKNLLLFILAPLMASATFIPAKRLDGTVAADLANLNRSATDAINALNALPDTGGTLSEAEVRNQCRSLPPPLS